MSFALSQETDGDRIAEKFAPQGSTFYLFRFLEYMASADFYIKKSEDY
jgi:hypothetical protein